MVPVRLLPHCARRTRSVSAAIGRFGRTPIHAGIRTGHCSCYGRRSPSRATIRAETQSILHSRSISKAPCPCRLLRFARMRRCAGPYHQLRCRCCRYVDLSVRGRAGPGRCVVCALPTRAVRAHARRPIVWRMQARSNRSLHRPGCCLQSFAVAESADTHMDTSIDQLPQPAAPPLPAPPASALPWYWFGPSTDL